MSDNNEIQEAYKEISKEGNSKSRINAISNINDDSFLETIAQTDDNIEVRLKATENINNENILINISKSNSDPGVRQLAKVRSCKHNFDDWDFTACCVDYPGCNCDPKGQLRSVCSICGIVAYKRKSSNGEDDITLCKN